MIDARLYELLASDASPVALLVLSGDGDTVRHVNRTMAMLLGEAPEVLLGRRLGAVTASVREALRPLVEAVAGCGRPRRSSALSIPFPAAQDAEQTWDAACAPLPADESQTPPALMALWLWSEDTGTVSSRRVAEALREGLRDTLPPVIPGFELAAALVPSEPGAALGGDIYDVTFLGDERWAILMADVSGRGPAAAARAVMVRHSARVLASRHGPGEVASYLSRLLLADPTFAGFVTAFLGVLDTAAGTLTYVSAGHEPAFLLRGDGGEIEGLEGGGAFPLGVDEDAQYPENSIPLTARDVLLLYTDGLTDTRRDEEFFDEERLRAALLRHRRLPAPALVATLLAEAADWAGPNALRDDTALLTLRGLEAASDL